MESGTVLGIVREALGTALATDALAADETLYVLDVAYFSPGGGYLTIDDGTSEETEVPYSGVDESTQTLLGVGPLVNGYDADDTRVNVYPLVDLQYAEVRLDGQQDTVRARVPYGIQQRVTDGYYSESNGETLRVLVELGDEGYVVADIIGTVPDVAVNSLSVLDDLEVQGELRVSADTPGTIVLEASVAATLEGQQAAPQNAPTVTQDWESVTPVAEVPNTDPDYVDYSVTARKGAYWDTTAGKIFYCGSANLSIRRMDPDGTDEGVVLSSVTNYFYGSITRIGSYYYVLAWHALSGDMRVLKYDTSWSLVDTLTTIINDGIAGTHALSDDGTDLWVANFRSSDNKLRLRRYTTAGLIQESITASGYTAGSVSDTILGYSARAADFGAETHVIISDAEPTKLRHFDASGVYDSLRVDNPATDHTAGLLWDGTNFWVMGDGSTISGVASSVLYKLESTYWDSSVSATKWLSYSWYDDAGTTHETTRGPALKFTGLRRKRWNWQTLDIPGNGGVDDPNGVRLYLSSGATEPADSSAWLQATPGAGIVSGTLTAILTSGSNPPAVNDFDGATPATIGSLTGASGADAQGTGIGWELDGSGYAHGFADVQVFTDTVTPGTWTKPKVGGCTMAEIHMVGGGGGGGGGRRSAAAGNASGGAGGGGGSWGVVRVPLSFLSATATVTVGAGGAGGAARSTTGAGNLGSDGVDSTVVSGSYTFTARGGKAGTVAATATVGGTAEAAVRDSSAGIGYGSTGADGSNTNTGGGSASPVPTNAGAVGAGGGGGGGGTNGASSASGGDGAASYDASGTIGRAGVTAVVTPTTKMVGHAFPGGGAGGSGGNHAQNCVAGGDGGDYGGGGGGGGGAAGFDSGAGGTGGDGIVVIVCY